MSQGIVKEPKCGQIISLPQKYERDSLYVKENVRNVNCKHYLACLDTAALANASDLGCENCQFRTDKTYKMTAQDFMGLIRLYYEIRDPRFERLSKRRSKYKTISRPYV